MLPLNLGVLARYSTIPDITFASAFMHDAPVSLGFALAARIRPVPLRFPLRDLGALWVSPVDIDRPRLCPPPPRLHPIL